MYVYLTTKTPGGRLHGRMTLVYTKNCNENGLLKMMPHQKNLIIRYCCYDLGVIFRRILFYVDVQDARLDAKYRIKNKKTIFASIIIMS